MPRLAYVILQLVCVLVAFTAMYTIQPVVDELSVSCGPEGTSCYGVSAVMRMTFALFCFHLVILIAILPRNGCASVIHDAGWTLKTILVFALFIGFFWVPIDFF